MYVYVGHYYSTSIYMDQAHTQDFGGASGTFNKPLHTHWCVNTY